MILLMHDLLFITSWVWEVWKVIAMTLVCEGISEKTWASMDKYFCCVCTKQISGNFTKEKLVYAWVNMIYRGRANIAKAYSLQIYHFFFPFPEDIKRGIDRRSNWQSLLWLSEGMQRVLKKPGCCRYSSSSYLWSLDLMKNKHRASRSCDF